MKTQFVKSILTISPHLITYSEIACTTYVSSSGEGLHKRFKKAIFHDTFFLQSHVNSNGI